MTTREANEFVGELAKLNALPAYDRMAAHEAANLGCGKHSENTPVARRQAAADTRDLRPRVNVSAKGSESEVEG